MRLFTHVLTAFTAFLLFASSASAAGLSKEAELGLQASQLAVEKKFKEAILIYNQLVQMDPTDANHYIQRGLMYRELDNQAQTVINGTMALEIANRDVQKGSKGKKAAKYYWQRAMAYRLMDKYDLALQDINTAIQLRGDQRWDPDRKSIVLEGKMHAAMP